MSSEPEKRQTHWVDHRRKPTGLTTDAKPTGLNRFTREQLAKQARSDLTRTCLYYQTNSYRSGGPSK